MKSESEKRGAFDVLLGARSVVVVGASNAPYKYGHLVLQSMLDAGYPGDLFLVNPRSETILGLPSFGSLEDIPQGVECAVIVVPAAHVPDSLRQCGEKGVTLAVVISGGFNEVGEEEGDRLYREMCDAAERFGIRMIGPNTFGTFTPGGRFNASFSPHMSEARPGRIVLLSQSGGVAHIMAYQAIRESIGLRSVVGLGNRANVDFQDLLRFFGLEDDETAAIGMYIEGVEDPPELLRAVRDVTPRKPVLVYKTGQTGAVAGPARSHTGSMAGRFELYREGLRQAGALWMNGPGELMDAARLCARAEPLRGGRTAILSIQAGAAIMLTDLCALQGLELASFQAETRASIAELLPPKTYLDNPVDMGFSWAPPVFIETARAVLGDPGVDILIVYALAVPGPMTDMMREVLTQTLAVRKPGQLLLFCTDTPSAENAGDLAAIDAEGIPVYLSPHRAVRSLAHRLAYERFRGRE